MNNNFNISPTDPVAVELTIKKNSATAAPAGVQYILNDGTAAVKGANLLNWTVVNDAILNQAPDTIITDTENPANALCMTGTGTLSSIIMPNSRTGEAKLKTIIYAPTVALAVNASSLDIRCFRDSGSARYMDIISNSSFTAPQGTVLLNNNSKARLVDNYNMNGMVGLVKDTTMCIEGTTSSTKFYWNGEKIFTDFG